MLPCFLGGLRSRFVASSSNAPTTRGRVSLGSMTSSTYPRLAAMYGFANRAVYSSVSRRRSEAGSAAAAISSRKMMLTAPSTPITAISALGQARLMSPRMCLLRSEEHTSELQSRLHLVCHLLLVKINRTEAGIILAAEWLGGGAGDKLSHYQ